MRQVGAAKEASPCWGYKRQPQACQAPMGGGGAMKSVGQRIRDLREGLGLNRAQFGEAIGINRKTLEAIERDGQRFAPEMVLTISQRFRTSPNALFGFDDIDRSAS
jgi:DNA-binding XRE family transcriptional regulator